MSTALAIASVTAVLKDLLNNGLIDHNVTAALGDVTVTALPPDRIDPTANNFTSRLNLFLYKATPNASWRNVGLPSRDSNGDRINNQPLALDLHYLLTAYGAEELHSEILLGYGMQILHETPILTRAAIRLSLQPPTPGFNVSGLPPQLQALFTSELAEQIELVKILPDALTMDESSNLWSAMQTTYRPSSAYLASVVLIESRRSTKSALPVRARNIYVVPFRQPVIEQIKSQATAGGEIVSNQPILANQNLVIAGEQLRGELTTLSISGVEVTPADADTGDTQIIAPIPASVPAGVQGVQVIHRLLMGSPPAPHAGVSSNIAAFVLQPRIIEPINVLNLTGAGSDPRAADINLTIAPPVGPTQRVVLLLNEFFPPASPLPSPPSALAYSFIAPSRLNLKSPPPNLPGPSSSLTIPVSGVRAGKYLARIQVDGAESVLGTDAGGRYVSPQVEIL